MIAAVTVVAGAPGTGKSTYAEALARRSRPVPALLDKDTVYGSFVDATLRAAGRPLGEREGDWYDAHAKVYEYAGLAATARQIRAAGCPVLLVAPFTAQIHDTDRWAGLVADLGGAPVDLIWVHCDPATLHRRLTGRGSHRDTAKLAAFDAFVTAIRLTEPPAVPFTGIDTAAAGPPTL